MKKALVLILALALLVLATSAFATIANTKHNMTTVAFTHDTSGTATLCGFCHIPHGGNTSIAQLPLWARALPLGSSYTVYGSLAAATTLSGTAVGEPGTFSLTCLSCHDGSIGVGTVTKNGVSSSFPMVTALPGGLTAGGAFQATNIDATNGYSPFIGTDLQNDHPVGFEFPAGGYGAGGGVPGISLTAALGFLTGTTGANYPVFTYAAPARTDVFECATCHDPHLEDGALQTKFLRSPNAAFCQDCHDLK